MGNQTKMNPRISILKTILATEKKLQLRHESDPKPWTGEYDWKDVVLAALEAAEDLSRQDFGDEAAEKWRDVRGLVNLWAGTLDELRKNLEHWS